MHAAHGLQIAVIKALHANGQAIDTGRTKGLEAVFLESAGVGLHGDFAVRLHAQTRAQAGNQLVYGLRRKQAGRATAHEYAVHRAPPDQRQRAFQIGHQRIDVTVFRQGLCLAPAMRIEIAIRAFLEAPGQVNIQGQRRQAAQLQRTGTHIVLNIALHRSFGRLGLRLNGDHGRMYFSLARQKPMLPKLARPQVGDTQGPPRSEGIVPSIARGA